MPNIFLSNGVCYDCGETWSCTEPRIIEARGAQHLEFYMSHSTCAFSRTDLDFIFILDGCTKDIIAWRLLGGLGWTYTKSAAWNV